MRLLARASLSLPSILVLLALHTACLILIFNAVSFEISRLERDRNAGFVASLWSHLSSASRRASASSLPLSFFSSRQRQPEPLRVWIDAFGLAKGEASIMLESIEVRI